jgi:exonuclease III
LTTAQKRDLTDPAALGCRNPIGLDHILVSKSLEGSVKSTRKISIGEMGRSLASILPENPDPVLAISDHCPMVTEIEL